MLSLLHNTLKTHFPIYLLIGLMLGNAHFSSAEANSRHIQTEPVVLPMYATSPKGVYKILGMLPGDTPAGLCQKGMVYINSEGELKVCNGSIFSTATSPWSISEDHNVIYPAKTDSDDLLKVGIGTETPQSKLAVAQRNDDNILNEIRVVGADQNENAGIQLITTGAPRIIVGPDGATHFAGYIDFLVGDQGNPYDGRIIYTDDPRNLAGMRRGLTFWGHYTPTPWPPPLWIDKDTRRIGIGTDAPERKLDVIGNTKVNKLYLKQNATEIGELKVRYFPSENAYFATYAP